jgi:hypothetical protein
LRATEHQRSPADRPNENGSDDYERQISLHVLNGSLRASEGVIRHDPMKVERVDPNALFAT